MALTPDDLATITVWHEQFVQRDPTSPWGRALEERFLGVADDWERLLEIHKADGVRSTLHVEQVDATLAWLRQRRSDLQEARAQQTTRSAQRRESAPAEPAHAEAPQPASEDKPSDQSRESRGGMAPQQHTRR